jgi:hypothetical protein
LGLLASKEMRSFLDHFATLGNAYRSGAMRYGLFVAEKACQTLNATQSGSS